MRTLFNKPIRKSTTEVLYPQKYDIDTFKDILLERIQDFKTNMNALGGKAVKPKHIEEWVEQYLAWLEIEQES